MTTVTRCGDHLSKVWIATLEQGRSTSAGERKWKMKSLRLSKHTSEQLEERIINHQDLLLEQAKKNHLRHQEQQQQQHKRGHSLQERRET